ncbi:uncharacterized protein LOC131881993 [Tigriopus californicus]|uniref:uncharacterized protein LOC131881993 n=1 Tax=Tigriopus californicus TaxID=6832 RepID=UPI0027DA320F|nr:uncharacterized protein LOC131881993 [Tigriopus californicus]
MANCLMEIDNKKCHGIEIDPLTHMCQLVSFKFTALACFGQDAVDNQTNEKEVYLKGQHVVSLQPVIELYMANLRYGTMEPISGNPQSLASLSFPFDFPFTNSDMKMEYRNGFLACQGGQWCYHWDFSSPGYVFYTNLETVLYHGLGLLGERLVLVESRGVNFPIQVFDPSKRAWFNGPPMNVIRTSVTLVTLNSTTIMAVGGRRGGDGSILGFPCHVRNNVERKWLHTISVLYSDYSYNLALMVENSLKV